MSETLEEIKHLGFGYITADFRSFAIYMIGFALTVFLCLRFRKNRRKTKGKVFLYSLLTALPLSVLAGLRYGVGTDYFNYVEIIHAARGGSYSAVAEKYLLEPGFNLFINVVAKLFHSDATVFFIMEYITLVVAFYAFARLHKQLDYSLAVGLYILMFYNFSLNISRQMMAMSFVLLGVSQLLTRRSFSYIICSLLAFSLHFSAIIGVVFGVLYFVFKKRKLSYTRYQILNVIYMLAILIFAFYVKDIMIFVFRRIPSISKYARYLNDSPDVTMFSFVKGLVLTVPLLLVGKYINRDTRLVFIRNCVWLYFVVATGAYYFAYITRMIMYIRLVIIFAVAMVYMRLEGRTRKLFAAYYTGIYALSYYYSFIVNNHADTFPYRLIPRGK